MFLIHNSRDRVSKQMRHEFDRCFSQMLIGPVPIPLQNSILRP